MATLALIVLIALVVVVLFGGGGYIRHRYYGPATGPVVVEGGTGGGAGLAIALLVLVLIALLFLIYGGFNIFGWFGQHVSVH